MFGLAILRLTPRNITEKANNPINAMPNCTAKGTSIIKIQKRKISSFIEIPYFLFCPICSMSVVKVFSYLFHFSIITQILKTFPV